MNKNYYIVPEFTISKVIHALQLYNGALLHEPNVSFKI